MTTHTTEWTHYKCVECGNIFDESLGKYGCCDKAAKPMFKPKTTLEEDVFGCGKPRKGCNGKKKGNTNERAAAKYLAEWVQVKFTRVPMSGGLRRVNVDKIVSDIIPDTNDESFVWPWVVETKHLKHIPIKRVLPNNSMVFSIWNQVHTDSLRANKLPFAMLRSNGMPAGEYYVVLDAAQGGTLMAMDVTVAFSGGNHKYSLIGFLLSDVKKQMPYRIFAQAVKRSNFVKASKIFNQ